MIHEIKNTLRSSSIIRVVDAGTVTININSLSTSNNEVVTSASLKRAMWSTNGNISIVRNGNILLSLFTSGDMRFTEIGHSIANNSTSDIVITTTSGGSLLLEVTKDTTYLTPIIGM